MGDNSRVSDPGEHPQTFRVCFVCTGNICRSPMAEIIFRDLAERRGLGHRLTVTSRGTGDWHVGEPADPRTVRALADAGFDGSRHRAAQFQPADFAANDLVVALDQGHLRALRSLASDRTERDTVEMLLGFSPGVGADLDVPDPYYGEPSDFAHVRDTVTRGCAALLNHLIPVLTHGESRS